MDIPETMAILSTKKHRTKTNKTRQKQKDTEN